MSLLCGSLYRFYIEGSKANILSNKDLEVELLFFSIIDSIKHNSLYYSDALDNLAWSFRQGEGEDR